MTIDDLRRAPGPESKYRRKARRIMLAVVDANPGLDNKALLKLVDTAYCFGPRKYHPYTMWLIERRLFIAALDGSIDLPSQDEIDACEVARDMVEEGRLDDARAALEQAPNRLARRCTACGAPVGRDCSEFTADVGATWILVPHHAPARRPPAPRPAVRGAMIRDDPVVTVVRRPADPRRRRRLVELLVDLLDKPTPDNPGR